MQNEAIGNNYSAPQQLSEPHFDEEATLLSAKPVVPLAVVKAKKNKRRFLFAGTIAAAVLVGMLGGMLIYSQRAHIAASNTVNQAQVQAAAEPAKQQDNQTVVDASIQDSEIAEEPKSVTSDEKPVRRSTRRAPDSKRPQARLVGVIRGSTAEGDRQPEYGHGADAQRPRRVKNRGGSSRNQDRDELFRIGEIFEGPQP